MLSEIITKHGTIDHNIICDGAINRYSKTYCKVLFILVNLCLQMHQVFKSSKYMQPVQVKWIGVNKNIERHTAHTIVSWPKPKKWVIVHTSDLMMIIRQSICILSTITREMGKLKTHSPTYCMMDNWENMRNLTHTLGKIYLTGIL